MGNIEFFRVRNDHQGQDFAVFRIEVRGAIEGAVAALCGG